MMKTMDEFGEACRKVIEADDFHTVPISELDPWPASIVHSFLEKHKIKWQVSRQKIGPGCVIKTDDEYLRWVLMMPHPCYEGQPCDQFYWLIGPDPNNDDHSVFPDVASAYLLRKLFPGAKVTEVKGDDGSAFTILDIPGHGKHEIHWPKGTIRQQNMEPK